MRTAKWQLSAGREPLAVAAYLMLQLQAVLVVHVAVVVVQIPLQGSTGLLLRIASLLGRSVVVAIARIPAGAVRAPWAKAHPAELEAARDVLARHMVATTILFNGNLKHHIALILPLAQSMFATHDHRAYLALWAVLCICVQPIGRLAVIVALLQPFLQEIAADGIVPGMGTKEAERVAAVAGDRARLCMRHFDDTAAVRSRAPLQQRVALKRKQC